MYFTASACRPCNLEPKPFCAIGSIHKVERLGGRQDYIGSRAITIEWRNRAICEHASVSSVLLRTLWKTEISGLDCGVGKLNSFSSGGDDFEKQPRTMHKATRRCRDTI